VYNKVIMMGRLVADPETRTTPSGANVANFRIAVDRQFQNKDGERKADFFTAIAWRTSADFISKYFHKGDMILIEGELQTRQYDDKDGNKRTATEIVVSRASFCGGKKDAKPDVEPQKSNYPDYSKMMGVPTIQSDGQQAFTDDDDLPF
jgi:single-strand DNA-binding protein